MIHSILLIGHRASGKTTLGHLLASDLGCSFYDLDEVIAERTGTTAADLVASDEARFRDLEIDTLRELLTKIEPSVIAAGGGLREFPSDMFVAWISRDGWEQDALTARARLRPEIAPDAEIAWMTETREPRYKTAAHIRLHIERGCDPRQSATRLNLLVGWLETAVSSAVMRMSWMRPRDREDLQRCAAQAKLFGMAGVEIRSDMFEELPVLDVPVLAALRTPDNGFFSRAARAAVFDCDTAFIQHLDLRGIAPRPLIFSTHPDDVFKEYFEHLTSLPAYIERAYPDWSSGLMLKYAPRVKSWVELRYANQLYKVYEKAGNLLSFFPQGKRWNWMRVQRLFAGNQLNYVSSGCEEHSRFPPSLDYFLPHCALGGTKRFYGVIGGDAENSIGDMFHRACADNSGSYDETYVKISLAAPEIDNCLHLLTQIGFKGLSVTAPLKRAVVESNFAGCEPSLTAGNTLALIKGSFMLYDTDMEGMLAALDELERNGIKPGAAVIFGGGGVSDAVRRALDMKSWSPIVTCSARDGWRTVARPHARLIVNASGANASEGAPSCDAWLDLRYRNIDPPPASAASFFNGMTFYKHQAVAQRKIWELPVCETLLESF